MKILRKLIIFLCLFSLQGKGQCVKKSRKSWEDYFKNNITSLSPLEGIWNMTRLYRPYNKYGRIMDFDQFPSIEVVIFKTNGKFILCVPDEGSQFDDDIVEFYATAAPNIFLHKRVYYEDGFSLTCNAILSLNSVLEFTYNLTEKMKMAIKNGYNGETLYEDRQLVKLFPTQETISASTSSFKNEQIKSSATGFAITSTGLIATNYHVVADATQIKVKGINGDFSKSYAAKIVATDKVNDLSIIEVSDISFTSLGIIPYVIQSKSRDVGTSIFCLGYPLRAEMGDEVKLTNGIVSSKSGFQGDISNYQISAPVQPGNSGAPLFESNGNLIGIVGSKFEGAENVSYAIKSSYLLTLLETISPVPNLQNTNRLLLKNLPEQVKTIRNFTYIIELN